MTSHPDLPEGLTGKRLIFSVATGRCGTAYLAELFKFLPHIDSHHEPAPEFADVMRSALRSPAEATQFLLSRKLTGVAASPMPTYVETSHLFCKGFLEPMLNLGLRPDIVALSRPAREVALSMVGLGTIPGRSDKGLRFYLSPDDPNVLPIRGGGELNDYQVCYWYCLEMARRTDVYETLCREQGCRYVRVTLAGISRLRGFRFLIKQLELPGPSLRGWLQYLVYHRNRVNESRPGKKSVGPPPDLYALEKDVQKRVRDARGETELETAQDD
ncbi:MAG: hypothetical protein O2923_00485 [Verrucomicrobia bacterium]|nr:hypothetical protein [Verrucomicrobiota bacterium]MDA1086040.1 hypothetical protein [Verrucomicrobiota bacterium]